MKVQDSELQKIILVFDNGEVKELKEGMVTILNGNELTTELVNISSKKFIRILEGYMQLWGKLNSLGSDE